MSIMCMRLGGLTGGICVADCRAMELERAYEAMYGLNPREISVAGRYGCSPEVVWKSIIKEHEARFGSMAATPGDKEAKYVLNQPTPLVTRG